MQEYKHSFIYARVVSLHRDMCVHQSKQGDSKTGNKSEFSSSVKQRLGAMIHLIIAGGTIISNVSMYRVSLLSVVWSCSCPWTYVFNNNNNSKYYQDICNKKRTESVVVIGIQSTRHCTYLTTIPHLFAQKRNYLHCHT